MLFIINRAPTLLDPLSIKEKEIENKLKKNTSPAWAEADAWRRSFL
jgi:hypothetical protein